jgi:hypothetical protein
MWFAQSAMGEGDVSGSVERTHLYSTREEDWVRRGRERTAFSRLE